MQDGTIDGKVNNEWGEYVFTGQETITINGAGGSNQYFKVIIPNKAFVNNNINLNNFCNYYKSVANNVSYYYHGSFTVSSSGDIAFCNTEFATAEAFAQDLATKYANGNPVIVQYKLATPSSTNFTTEQQAVYNEIISEGTYTPVTHYMSNATLNPDIDMTYYRDLPTIINNLEN